MIDNAFVYFTFENREYRTNADASIVEGSDGGNWNRTGSLRIILAALAAIKA